MSASNQTIEPYYMQFLRCAKCSRGFEYENQSYHPITLPTHDATICKQCISVGTDHTSIDQLPTNYPLLIILYDPSKLPKDHEERYGQCPFYMKLDDETKTCFNTVEKGLSDIAIIIKPILKSEDYENVYSRSLLRKIFGLFNSQYINREGRLKILKTIRSLGEHICIDLYVSNQIPQQLKNKAWSIVGFTSRKFYEPAMQEKVLQNIVVFFQSHEASRTAHVIEFVKKNIQENDGAAIAHMIDILSGKSCFIKTRMKNYSLIELQQQYKIKEHLRDAYDEKIIQIAFNEGMLLSAGFWSLLLYGNDTQYELQMEKIIDKLSISTTDLFDRSIKQFRDVALGSTSPFKPLLKFEKYFIQLAQIGDYKQEHLNASIFVPPLEALTELVDGERDEFDKQNEYVQNLYQQLQNDFTKLKQQSSFIDDNRHYDLLSIEKHLEQFKQLLKRLDETNNNLKELTRLQRLLTSKGHRIDFRTGGELNANLKNLEGQIYNEIERMERALQRETDFYHLEK
ncbi:unnamed protein product [Rotaria sp. Silwood1]|nr:unnamed protein product [Rotaria sp. Silwood1]CAF1550364.1 unnamed protein product [Rotaria sp. Silwood1]